MSFIVRFDSAEGRGSFLKRLATAVPQAVSRVRPSRSDERVVVVNTTDPEEESLLRGLTGPDSKLFEDVQMQPFDPGN